MAGGGRGKRFLDKDNPLRWRVGRAGRFFPPARRSAISRSPPPSARHTRRRATTGAPLYPSPPLPPNHASVPQRFNRPSDYLVRTRARTEKAQDSARRRRRASERASERANERARAAGGRRAPVDGEPLWSMAAPSSGGGRRADVEPAAAVVVVATVVTTTTAAAAAAAAAAATTTAAAAAAGAGPPSNKMTSLLPPQQPQRPSAAPSRLADTQVAAADKSHRRKISLPWFRQASASTAAAALARQHTIDTPSSYRHRPTAARSAAASPSQVPCHAPQPTSDLHCSRVGVGCSLKHSSGFSGGSEGDGRFRERATLGLRVLTVRTNLDAIGSSGGGGENYTLGAGGYLT